MRKVSENKDDLILLGAGVSSAVGIALVSTIINAGSPGSVPPSMIILYILAGQILLLLARNYLFIKNHHNVLLNHHKVLLNAITPPANIKLYRQGKGSDIFSVAGDYKKRSQSDIYGMWCVKTYNQEILSAYYKSECELKAKRHRLINTKSIDPQVFRDHVTQFANDIHQNRYFIYPTDHEDFEFLLCFQVDDSGGAIAFQFMPRNIDDDIGVAISCDDQDVVGSMRRYFYHLKKGDPLIINDPNNSQEINKSIDHWLQKNSMTN